MILTDASLFSLRRRQPLVLRYEVFETGEAKIEFIGYSKSTLIKTVLFIGKSCDFKYIFNGLCIQNYKKTILIENVMEGSDTIAAVVEIHTRYFQNRS